MQPPTTWSLLSSVSVTSVVQAWRGRKPGGLSWALSHVVVAHNRRAVYADGNRAHVRKHQ